MEVKRERLGYTLRKSRGEAVPGFLLQDFHALETAIHFISGGEDDDRGGRDLPGCLEHIDRSTGVDLEVFPRVIDGGGHRNLCREVEDSVSVPHRAPERCRVARIAFDPV